MKDGKLEWGTKGKQVVLPDLVNLESRMSSCAPGLGFLYATMGRLGPLVRYTCVHVHYLQAAG